MITTEILENKELIDINTRNLVARAYSRAGVPVRYHFADINTSWSTEFSTAQKLTGLSKKLSEQTKKFVSFYIEHLDVILNGGGLKVKKKNSSQIVKNIVFCGGKVSGKTLLLSLIAQSAINSGYKVLYLDWVDLFSKFQTWDSQAENQKILEAAMNCDILFIDSIYSYSQTPTPSFLLLIDQLINHRKNNDLVICCSTTATENLLPNLGPMWNQFIRETFTIQLPEANLTYEDNTKRPRTKNP